MEMTKKVRPLNKDEIEVRVDRITENAVSLLLYKNARVDMSLMDETFGTTNWKREFPYRKENGEVDLSVCRVSVWDEAKKEWISKEDVGTPSNFESEKGLASDAFKRACTNWGVGRELYDVPDLRISKKRVNITANKGGKEITYDTFSVADMCVRKDDGHINALAIRNNTTGKLVYLWDVRTPEEKEEAAKKKAPVNPPATSLQGESIPEETTETIPAEAEPEATPVKQEPVKTPVSDSEPTYAPAPATTPSSVNPADVKVMVNGGEKSVNDLTMQQARWAYAQPNCDETVKAAIKARFAGDEKAVAFFAKQGLSL